MRVDLMRFHCHEPKHKPSHTIGGINFKLHLAALHVNAAHFMNDELETPLTANKLLLWYLSPKASATITPPCGNNTDHRPYDFPLGLFASHLS